MLLLLWQHFLFRGCGNTTSKAAGQLWEVSGQCFLWLCLAIVQHWPYTLGQVTPSSSLHHILSIWPLASPWLLSRCHQLSSMLCCAVFPYHTFLLKSTNHLLQPEWPNMDKLQPRTVSHGDPLAQAYNSVLSPTQVTLCSYSCEIISSSSNGAQEQCWTKQPFIENLGRFALQKCNQNPKPWLRVTWEALNRLNHSDLILLFSWRYS